MAQIKSKTLFFTTSPRSPIKMIPEIKLLAQHFSGKSWNKDNQIKFIELLAADGHFEGIGSQGDLAFSARDRINRAPKALGFIDLKPSICLTDAGKIFVEGKRKEEALLRQLLKFQLPSPFHTSDDNEFWVKPYLEILRLISVLGKITFDELMIFGLQLTNYNRFDEIVSHILEFRKAKESFKGKYKVLCNEVFNRELEKIYENEILQGNTSTRESADSSIDKFKKTKRSNMRDYTDACFRYLRATGLVSISYKGKSLSIMADKANDVAFLLENTERNPIFVHDEQSYKHYLFNANTPVLYSDSRANLIAYIISHSPLSVEHLDRNSINELKDIRDDIIQKNKDSIIADQVRELKSYHLFNDVINTYNEIIANDIYDVPLMLEWNTWRAMTMLDGGNITGNFKVDDNGQPLSTAIGNTPDIVCDYDDFGLTVEVTMQSGQRQYETEGEPVARHLAKHKKSTNKEVFCLFIAPRINEACIAHFFTLSKTNISYYGGKSIIVPLPLETFIGMVKRSYAAPFTPTPRHIKELFEFAKSEANKDIDEQQWYSNIQQKAMNWLVA